MFAVRTAMLLFPFGLLAISGRVRAAGLMLAAYLGTCALAAFAAPALEGFTNAIIVATATVVSPLRAHARARVFRVRHDDGVRVHGGHGAHAHARLDHCSTIGAVQVLSHARQEARAVNAAMRMRGITPISPRDRLCGELPRPAHELRRLHRRGPICGRSGPRARRALAEDEHRQHRVHAGRCRGYRRNRLSQRQPSP